MFIPSATWRTTRISRASWPICRCSPLRCSCWRRPTISCSSISAGKASGCAATCSSAFGTTVRLPTPPPSRRSSSTASAISALPSAFSPSTWSSTRSPTRPCSPPPRHGRTKPSASSASRRTRRPLSASCCSSARWASPPSCPPARLAARRDGGADAGLGPHSRRHHGHRRRVHGRALLAPVRAVRNGARGGRHRRRGHRVLRRHRRAGAKRHQARHRLFHVQPAGLHVFRLRRLGLRGGHLPPDTHAFFKALLFLGAGAAIHAMSGEQDMRRMGGLAPRRPLDLRVHVGRVARACRHPAFRRLSIPRTSFSNPPGRRTRLSARLRSGSARPPPS